MKYVYGYDIRCILKLSGFYEEKPRTVGKGDRYTVISETPLSDNDVAEKVIRRITTASCCRHSKSLDERLEDTRQMFEITNVKIVRQYGK